MNNKWSNQQSQKTEQSLTLQQINNHIYTVRGQKVMLDEDLAQLYGVETKVFNQAVKRNLNRFPEDFMFQLSKTEYHSLRSQFVTSNELGSLRSQSATSTTNESKGGRRYMPYVFTEQGVAMLSSVLNSNKAIEINISIMRTFVKMRDTLINNQNQKTLNPSPQPRKLLQRNPQPKSNQTSIATTLTPIVIEPFYIDCPTLNYRQAMASMERDFLLKILKEAGNSIHKAMQISGIPKTTFYRLLRKHNLKISGNLMLIG
ncbi:MAG: ORF6N domain-containing protein [Blastocatellia bacterium]